MKRILISFFLSVFIHVTAFAAITTIQLLAKPKKRIVNVMMIKPVKISDIKSATKAEPPKKVTTQAEKPKVEKPKLDKDKIAKKKPDPKPLPSPKATPKPTPTPPPVPDFVPSATPVSKSQPVKKPVTKKPKAKTQKEKDDEIKIAVLKKYPYFKNWSNERIKRLELPPGMKNWQEAEKLTKFLDTQYNWAATPPNLGDEKPSPGDVNPYETPPATPTPQPTPTDDPLTPKWKEYQDKNASNYNIRFYKDKTGFIATFKEVDNKVLVEYFPFDADKAKQQQTDPNADIEVKIPQDLKKEDIKSFELPLTKEDIENRKNSQQDKLNKDQLVRDIIRTYNQENNKP